MMFLRRSAPETGNSRPLIEPILSFIKERGARSPQEAFVRRVLASKVYFATVIPFSSKYFAAPA